MATSTATRTRLLSEMSVALDGCITVPAGEVGWIVRTVAGDSTTWIVETLQPRARAAAWERSSRRGVRAGLATEPGRAGPARASLGILSAVHAHLRDGNVMREIARLADREIHLEPSLVTPTMWIGRLSGRQWRCQMRPDERSIREVHSAWIDAVNENDLGCLLRLMADDVVFLNPGREPLGRDGFPAGFSAAHQAARIQCISELVDVVVVGEVAYTLSRDSLCVAPRAAGEATYLAGHRIAIYRKQSDGRWLLARDAHTLAPVAGPTP